MNEADARKRHLRVPKGTSDYQASWIFDAEEVEQDEDSEDDEVRFRYWSLIKRTKAWINLEPLVNVSEDNCTNCKCDLPLQIYNK